MTENKGMHNKQSKKNEILISDKLRQHHGHWSVLCECKKHYLVPPSFPLDRPKAKMEEKRDPQTIIWFYTTSRAHKISQLGPAFICKVGPPLVHALLFFWLIVSIMYEGNTATYPKNGNNIQGTSPKGRRLIERVRRKYPRHASTRSITEHYDFHEACKDLL